MSEENLWDFSLRIYAEDSVAEACLTLQNEHGLDVNLLLFCVWHANYHGTCTESVMKEAVNFSLRWRENVVQPLRSARRWMKDSASTVSIPAKPYAELRDNIKRIELSSERLQQNQLASLLSNQASSANSDRLRSCEKNLAAYLQAVGIESTQDLRDSYVHLVNAAIL